MALSEEITNELKVLIYEKKDFEAIKVLKRETDLSYDEATKYVHRLKESLGQGVVKPVKSNTKMLLFIFAGVSVLFWILAIIFYISKSDQIERSALVEGTVTRMLRDESGTAPVVSYRFNEQDYEYTSSIYSTPPAYEVGEVVELYVVLDNPEEAMINSFVDRWLLILIFAFLAIVFDIAAVAALKMKSRSVSSAVDFLDKDDSFSRSFD